MKHHTRNHTPALEPGEVVWANVMNPHQNRASRGKPRPAILLRACGSQWQVMGLTTNTAFSDGTPRHRIEQPRELGLHGESFLWGSITTISRIDILDHIGWVDIPTATKLASNHPRNCSLPALLGDDEDLTTAA